MWSEGNQFVQALNDSATLKNLHKRVALGLEIVGPGFECYLSMSLFMVWIKDGTGKDGCDTISKIYEERVEFKCKVIVRSTTSDRHAKGMATMFNHDEDVFDVHYCDKIDKSARSH